MALSKAEAEKLTKQLKSKTQTLAKLITKAHDEQVWVPMGYKSFTEWADKELPFTYARAFQLLNIGVLTEQLTKTIALPETFMLTDTESRAISTYGRTLFLEAIQEEATEDAAANVSKIKQLLSERAPVNKKAEKTERTKPQLQTPVISGGERLSHTRNVHVFQRHTQDFPEPANLDRDTREQGITILLQAQSTVQKKLDDIQDRNKQYENHKNEGKN